MVLQVCCDEFQVRISQRAQSLLCRHAQVSTVQLTHPSHEQCLCVSVTEKTCGVRQVPSSMASGNGSRAAYIHLLCLASFISPTATASPEATAASNATFAASASPSPPLLRFAACRLASIVTFPATVLRRLLAGTTAAAVHRWGRGTAGLKG